MRPPSPTDESLHLVPLSGFDVGADSLTDTVRPQPAGARRVGARPPLAAPVPLPGLRRECRTAATPPPRNPSGASTPRDVTHEHMARAPLSVSNASSQLSSSTHSLRSSQARVEASCKRIRVGDPVVDVGKQTLAPGQGQCGKGRDSEEQGSPNQPSSPSE